MSSTDSLSGHNSGATPASIYLDVVGWSGRQLAEILGVSERSVWRWLNGQNETPPKVLTWLKLLADFHSANPQPDGWVSGEAKN